MIEGEREDFTHALCRAVMPTYWDPDLLRICHVMNSPVTGSGDLEQAADAIQMPCA